MNELIEKIIKQYYNVDESIGSYLIKYDENGTLKENDNILNIVHKILYDINSTNYLKHKLSDIELNNVQNELCLSKSAIIYSLTYYINLFWINYLRIFIIEDKNYYDIHGIPYIESEQYTSITNNRYDTIAIGLFNVKENNLLEDTLIHEIKHVYMNYLKIGKESHDIDIQYYNKFYNLYTYIDFDNLNKDDINKNINNYKYVESLLYHMLYILNNEEIECYKENILNDIKNNKDKTFNDICNSSIIIKRYNLIKYIIDILLNKSNNELNRLISNNFIESYRQIINISKRKSISPKYILNKYKSKLNKIFKHIYKQYEFWKTYK
jgi:hypothetical protein